MRVYPFGTIRKAWQATWGQDVTLARKSASNQHRVRCPYHDDRNPSCDVDLAKNTFFCRSCEAQGGVLDVVILAGDARTHAQAAEWLRQHGVALP